MYTLSDGERQKTVYGVIGTALMALTAKYCARIRRTTGRDPAQGIRVESNDCFLQIGVLPAEVERHFSANHWDKLKASFEEASSTDARSLLQEIYRLLSAQPSSPHEVAHFIGKSYLAEQHHIAAFAWPFRSYALEPNRIGKMLKSRIGSLVNV